MKIEIIVPKWIKKQVKKELLQVIISLCSLLSDETIKVNHCYDDELHKEKKNELYNLFSTLQPMIYKAMDVLDDGKL